MTRQEILRKIEETKENDAKSFDLSFESLEEIPPEIGELINIERLDLSRIPIKKLPPEIGQLRNLKKLYFYGCQLLEVPSEIGQLSNLEVLDLSYNQIKNLPAEIGQLEKLQQLDLSGNKLQEIPVGVTSLSGLQRLYINYNILSKLTEEIRQLRNLRQLDLKNNRLTVLPSEISRLTLLEQLDVSNNKLEELPLEIEKLNNLQRLLLDGNKLNDLPEAVIADGENAQEIIRYYLTIKTSETRPLNEAKVLVIGQGDAGKTCLIKRLIHDTYNPHENQTRGIEIYEWKNIGVNNQSVQLNIWDFGGQEIQHGIHQFFFTEHCLYILVLNSRSDDEQSRAEYWLEIVKSLGKDSPVIIVGSKVDQDTFDINKDDLLEKYQNIKGFYEVSSATKEGMDKLKSALIREAGNLRDIYKPFPVSWVTIKEYLKNVEENFITYEEYADLCKRKGIIDEHDQETLIYSLNQLGIIRCFLGDLRLQDTSIMKPKWIVKGIYEILHFVQLKKSDTGIFNREALYRILDPQIYPPETYSLIIKMMEKFELCYEAEGAGNFLVPGLLPSKGFYTGEWKNAFELQYSYEVFFHSIIGRFICRMRDSILKNVLWRNGILIKYRGNEALIEAVREDKKILVKIRCSEDTRLELLEIIHNTLDEIHKKFRDIKVQAKLLISEGDISPDVCFTAEFNLTNIDSKGLIKEIEGIRKRHQVNGLPYINKSDKEGQDKKDNWKDPRLLQNVSSPNDPTIVKNEVEAIAQLTDTFKQLDSIKTAIDEKSDKQVRTYSFLIWFSALCIWLGMISMNFIIGFDKMEQWVTWIIPSGFSIFVYGYLAVTTQELSISKIREKFVGRKKQQNYLSLGFDLERYEDLRKRVTAQRQPTLSNPGN